LLSRKIDLRINKKKLKNKVYNQFQKIDLRCQEEATALIQS